MSWFALCTVSRSLEQTLAAWFQVPACIRDLPEMQRVPLGISGAIQAHRKECDLCFAIDTCKSEWLVRAEDGPDGSPRFAIRTYRDA